MADIPADGVETPKKSSKVPLVIGLALMLALAGGGFYATFSGLILGTQDPAAAAAGPDPLPAIGFVPLDPILISLGPGARARHLRFSATLEVTPAHQAEVELLKPRIIDVLNDYLRAVEISEIEERAALIRLRAQMLRRVQIVTGEGRVRDLLVLEFVLN